MIGGIATFACLAKLETLFSALLTSRIVIQFVGQIVTVFYLRRTAKAPASTYRMPLYPFPALVALAGWLFVFCTSEKVVLAYGLLSLLAGVAAFWFWNKAVATV